MFCDWKLLQYVLLNISVGSPLCQNYREKRGVKVIDKIYIMVSFVIKYLWGRREETNILQI